MNLQYEDGSRLTLGKPLGRGGEATVYSVRGDRHMAAKIYHRTATERTDKLRLMIGNPPDDPGRSRGHVSIAWPRRLLLDEQGSVAGYTMTAAGDTRTLADVYHPGERRRTLPQGFTYQHLLRTAANLCSAVAAINDMGYVIGDLNDCNVLVRGDTLVTVIDCDSFQVAHYLCTVARPEYLAPELHGRALDSVVRSPEHDAFALAVLVHQLLMGGVHPYAGRGEPGDLASRVAAGLCPYSPGSPAAPVGAYQLEWLPDELQQLFRDSFVDGHRQPACRPPPRRWTAALAAAEKRWQSCRQQPDHPNFSTNGSCPVCEAAARRPAAAGVGATAQRPLHHRARRRRRLAPVLVAVLCMTAPLLGSELRHWLDTGELFRQAGMMAGNPASSNARSNVVRDKPTRSTQAVAPAGRESARRSSALSDNVKSGSEIYREYLGEDPY